MVEWLEARPDLKSYKILIVGHSDLLRKTGALLRECGASVGYGADTDTASTLARLTRPNAVVISLTDEAFGEVLNTARLYSLRVITFMENAPRLSDHVAFNEDGLIFAHAAPIYIVQAVGEHASRPTAC